ncbi:MAG: hypothetical protein ABI873_17640 [Marmoricola sp.]
MSVSRWVRQTSEHYLMIDAMEKVGRRLGANTPERPRGAELFWRRVYVPVFHALPARVRDGVVARMPGSHRKEWRKQPPLKGPAV